MIVFLFIAFLLFLISLTILKTNNLSPRLFNFLQHVPHHDKLGHFLLMGILAYLAIASISPLLKSRNINYPQLIVGSVVSLVIIIEETSQACFPTRSCSYLDAAAGITGVIIAAMIYKLTSPAKTLSH